MQQLLQNLQKKLIHLKNNYIEMGFKFLKPCLDCDELFRPEGVGHTTYYCKECRKKRRDMVYEKIRKNNKIKT